MNNQNDIIQPKAWDGLSPDQPEVVLEKPEDQVYGLDLQIIRAWPKPDEEGVLTECNRIKEMRNNFDSCELYNTEKRLSIMTILLALPSPNKRIHDFFRKKPGYDYDEIEQEIETAKQVGGCMQCFAINARFSGKCAKDCKYLDDPKVVSPIKLKGPNHIKTEETGFWNVKHTKNGPQLTAPNYEDLLKAFKRDHEFVSMEDTGHVYIYTQNLWSPIEQLAIKGFVQDKLFPRPKETQRNEFLSLVRCSNLKPADWLSSSIEGFINLQNGVFNIETSEMSEHNQKFGFRYILPYQYVPGAKAPRFEKFLDEITCNRKDMAQVLLEFMGYALSNSSCYAEKALILYGEGSNGKSTFMEVLKALAGKDNYASLSLTALNKDTKRYMIDGKLFNIGEETSVKALGESEVFKTMVTGGEIDVKKLYSQDYTIKNRCKLIMACNELPKSADRSEGLYRRMILVPFDAKFTEESKDPHMKEKLVEELPGIFNMCVEAYRRLKANKYQFTQSIALMEAMESYRVENDNVLQWINERFQFTGQDEDFWFKDDMYDDYAKFCKEAGNYAISKISFCRSLKLRFPDITETRRVRPGLSLERHRAFIGCRMAYTI